MPKGIHKTRDYPTHVLVNFGNASHEVDEHTYRKMMYLPDFGLLPWDHHNKHSILIIDVMPNKMAQLSMQRNFGPSALA